MQNLQESATSFDFNDRLGLVFIVEGAALSVLAITSLLAYITVGVLFNLQAHRLTPSSLV
jgi:hypothetical protein